MNPTLPDDFVRMLANIATSSVKGGIDEDRLKKIISDLVYSYNSVRNRTDESNNAWESINAAMAYTLVNYLEWMREQAVKTELSYPPMIRVDEDIMFASPV